jgi:alkylhydroperoxidase family enzyme
VSALFHQQQVDLQAVVGAAEARVGVAHGRELVAFVDAVMQGDDAACDAAREALRGVLTPAAFVDACAVLGAFNSVDRIADATGLPLDDRLAAMSGDVRRELGISRFGSAANTPDAR